MIEVEVSGGTQPYSYQWSNGAATQNISQLVAGVYTLTLTDDNGCTASFSADITQPDSIWIEFSITHAYGAANGSIETDISGGVPPYSYLWSNNATTQHIYNLLPGTYTLTLTDGNSCVKNRTGLVENAAVCTVIIDSIQNVLCHGESNGGIYVTVQGAISPSFLWSDGSTNEDLTNVQAGVYTLTITDDFGCNIVVTDTVNEPPPLNINLNVTHTTCGNNNGSITATATGGTGLLSYLWNTGSTLPTITGLTAGTYTVTVTDNNQCTASASTIVNPSTAPLIILDSIQNVSCHGDSTGNIYIAVIDGIIPYQYNWSDGSSLEDLISVSAGNYTVTVTDQAGCTASLTAIITQPAAPLSVDLTIIHSTCGNANGSMTAIPSGGTPNYSFFWSNGQTTATAVNLSANIYTVTVSDDNGCSLIVQDTINTTPLPQLAVDSVVQVSCFGQSDGGVYISVTNMTSGLSFLWSEGSTTEDLINVPAGSYTVTVTDSLGCSSSVSATVSQPSLLQDSVTIVNATCNNTNGSATIWPYGGTSPYTFLWSTGATTASISGVAAGSYTVTITDQKGCTRTRLVVVNNIGGPVITIDSVRHVRCHGESNGAIYTSVSGGVLPYIVRIWSNGFSNTDSIVNLTAGSYTYIVIDANNCLSSVTQLIIQPDPITATAQLIHPTCLNANGSIEVNPAGGTSPYAFQWSTGATTSLISGLSAGSYTVTITDTKFCTATFTYTLTTNGNPVIVTDSVVQVKCNGQNTGSIYISVSGGTAPYSYLWSDGFTGQDNIFLQAGTYTVTVTDQNGCIAIQTFTVTQPAPLTVQVSTTPSTCNTSNGTASALVSGGTLPISSYLWTPGGQSTPFITGLSPGVYSVDVTDANGCTASGTGTVTTAGNPVILLDSLVNVTCHGYNNGVIAITPSGGTPGYFIIWIPGGQTDTILQNLSPGNYTVIVSDAQNCITQQTFTITQPDVLQDSLVVVHEICYQANGTITAYPYGGTSPYQFQWSNGATTAALSGLTAGIYTVTITDNNGCITSATATVFNLPGHTILTDTIIDVQCHGESNGAVQVSIVGGTPPYTFQWSSGATTQNLTGATAGVYTLTVIDFNQCVATANYTVNEPAILSDSLQVVQASCGLSNGQITVFPYGGNGGYTFLWNTGATSATISSLNTGTYTVTITDSKGCTMTDSATITNDVPLSFTISQLTEPLCHGDNNGIICIQVNGGSAPFNYQWSNGSTQSCTGPVAAGTFALTVTDTKGCTLSQSFNLGEPAPLVVDSLIVNNATCNQANGSLVIYPSGGTSPYAYQWSGSPNDTLASLSQVNAGVYTVTVTDANGCSVTATATITNTGVPFIQSFTIVDVKCHGGNDGFISVTAGGGLSPYSYQWSTSPTDTLNAINNLAAGVYSLTITDASGCSVVQSFTVNQPSVLSDSIEVIQPVCGQANGSITVFPYGGTSPYSFQWSTSPTDTLNVINNLLAGTYIVTITDWNGCSRTEIITLTDPGPPSAVVTNIQDVSCYGGNDGSIQVIVTGGTPPYQFLWSNGSTAQNLSGATAQNYTLTVTDSLGCIEELSQVISEPPPLTLVFSITQASCDLSDGSVTVHVSGGTPGYSFLWSTWHTDSTVTNLPAGVYTVTVTDNNGCIADSTISITNPDAPVISSATVNHVLCHGDSTGSIYPIVQGGTPPLSFQWSTLPVVTTQNLVNVPAGVYTVLITDGANCTVSASYYITEPAPLQASINITPSTCGNNNGEAQVLPSGGTGNYTYLWSNGSTAPTLSSISGGVYTVTITDENNCQIIQLALVPDIDGPQISLIDSSNVTCPEGSDGFIQIEVSGGTFPYTILWSNMQTGTIISNLPGNTTYTVTVTDSMGCISFLTVFISEPAVITANAVVSQLNGSYNIRCFGEENGSVILNPQGGTPPYSFLWSNISFNQNLLNVGAGSYTVTITDAQGCTESFSYQLTQPPPVIAATTGNIQICGIDTATLQAISPAYGNGYWVSLGSGPVILYPDSSITAVSNLSQGNNFFQWIVTDGVCYDTAQSVITLSSEIIAIAGVDREICEAVVTLTATPPQFGYGYWQLVSGNGIILDSSKAQTQVVGLSPGAHMFRWVVVNGSCTDDALITITRLPEDVCRDIIQIPSGFTPNGDGFNDVFLIKGLEDYPENSLIIYNRWGNRVFEQSPYLNRWNGVNMNNELLPEGTYFYILTVKTTGNVYHGFVDLRR
jgi:gliding motility-associated-like protein